jgi:hypothetical protein
MVPPVRDRQSLICAPGPRACFTANEIVSGIN